MISREHFEERIFNFRFVQSIGRVNHGQFGLASRDCPTMREFCRKDEQGEYEEAFVAGAWWAVTKFTEVAGKSP